MARLMRHVPVMSSTAWILSLAKKSWGWRCKKTQLPMAVLTDILNPVPNILMRRENAWKAASLLWP